MTEFSLESYRTLISKLLKLDHQFVRMSDNPDKGIILRHDVDYSPPWAANIADINAQLGVRATFFVLVNSPLYNLFSDDSAKALESIIDCGQDIGLHYCFTKDQIQIEQFEQNFEILRMAIPAAKPCIAWHNPEGDLEQLNAAARSAGFICAYNSAWFSPDRYISDSNLRHSPQQIFEFVKSSTSPLVQLLCHPFNWINNNDTMIKVLTSTLEERISTLEKGFNKNVVWKEGNDLVIWQRLCSFKGPPWQRLENA